MLCGVVGRNMVTDITVERLAEMQESLSGPECPECGLPMVGELTDEGEWCPTCKTNE